MKEITFRGKRKDNNEWIYGDLIRNYDGRIFVGEVVVTDYIGKASDRYNIGVGFEEVELTTVTQFTNLVDRNGVKLFEGDVINVYRYKDYTKVDCIGIVLDNHSFIEDGLGRCMPQDTITVELIGNIFDNPELISEGSKRRITNYWDWPEDVYDIK